MALLRSLLFNILMYAWTVAVVILGLPTLMVGPRAIHALARFWARGIFWLLAGVVGLRHRILGRERLPSGPVIAAVKHQSTWDIMACALLFPEPAYVLKRELTWLPVFGWYLQCAGMIPVDRRAGGAALRRMLRQARRVAEEGRPIVIYPEGTRTAPGEAGTYHPGVAALYEQLNVPVVPIALNSGLFWGRRRFLKRPGMITLEILEPIESGLERRAFLAELHRRIETAALRLMAEASVCEASSTSAKPQENLHGGGPERGFEGPESTAKR